MNSEIKNRFEVEEKGAQIELIERKLKRNEFENVSNDSKEENLEISGSKVVLKAKNGEDGLESIIKSHGFFSSLKIVIFYLISDLKKRQRSFKIGFMTILIVVGFLTFLQSAIQLAPLMFLKMAENTMGAVDILLTPLPNTTKILNPQNLLE
jgi:hypothetical protein